VCENNLYNEYTHYLEATAGEILDRPRAFGIHAEQVDGQDVRAVHAAAQGMVERARTGGGPAFLACHTYRFHGHHVGDVDRAYYRSKDEEQAWQEGHDPLVRLATWLRDQGVEGADLDAIAAEAQAEVDAGMATALDAPFPDPSEVDQHVYA
jgi:pyruvate dehydrogenase E1 component alpha subunit